MVGEATSLNIKNMMSFSRRRAGIQQCYMLASYIFSQAFAICQYKTNRSQLKKASASIISVRLFSFSLL